MIQAATMKAIRMHRVGGPEVLVYEDVPRPQPGRNELLVRVYAASINPSDSSARQGVKGPFPSILGHDISGEVVERGSDADGFEIGDAVYALLFPQGGGYAKYAIAPVAATALKPHNLSHVDAASVPLAALTAWQAFEKAHLTAGQTVLIHAAAGGVGMFAVQLAKARGTRVIGTASARNHDFLRSLGADEVIDYTHTRFEEQVHGVDVVLDTQGGETQRRSWAVLRRGGFLISLKGIAQHDPSQEVDAASMTVKANSIRLTQVTELIEVGQVRPIVERVLPLSQAKRAHELIDGKHTQGKVVLQVNEAEREQ